VTHHMDQAAVLMDAIGSRTALIGVIGLGYVGIPLALAAVQGQYRVLGFDIDPDRTERINRGESFIKHIPSTVIAEAVKGKLKATTDFALRTAPPLAREAR
jgi:UDP-N-acetyl-D-glucosamine dehydrogenase